ncbi:MAG TPA: DUF3810 domain-containing protein [Bacteroidales bacterium]|nr:DUF3810 domain-containing protein [Bacteroidales bacterium]
MNKQKSWRNIILNALPFILGLIVLILVKLSPSYQGEVEEYYSNGIYPLIAAFISNISSLTEYSLWDIFWISMSLFVIAGLILVLLKKISFGRYFLRFCQMLAIFYSIFYVSWGFNYFRPDLKTRLGWSVPKPDEESFRRVLDSLIVSTNRSFTEVDYTDYASIDEALESSFSKCSDILAINYPNGTRTPKTILISSYFAKSGVSGYFGPFFNEVHINHYQLPGDYPFIIGHEKAHQFGIANEAEANLASFIVCTNSDDIRLQYSGYMHLLLYFLNEAHNMPGYGSFLAKIDKPVMKDILRRERYYENLRNKKLENIQNAANNAYLKTQHIEKGIKNYNQVVALTICWYAESGKLPVQAEGVFAQSGEKMDN